MKIKQEEIFINISAKTILKIILIILILFFLYFIRDILGIFLVSLVLSSIMFPLIEFLSKKKIPRILSLISIYLLFFCLIVLIFYLIIPLAFNQVSSIVIQLNKFIDKNLNSFLAQFGFQTENLTSYIQKSLESLTTILGNVSQNIYSLTIKAISGLATFILILVLAFYLTIEKNAIDRVLKLFLPPNLQKDWLIIIHKAQRKMGLWLGGQLIMSFIIFLLSYFAFLILRLDSALILALIMGLLEIIPYFGPLIGGILVALVGFSYSFWLGIISILVVFIIQQIENHILEPNIMGKITGLSPVIIILGILIGVKIFGILGMIIAIPITIGIAVILQEVFGQKKQLIKNQLKMKEE